MKAPMHESFCTNQLSCSQCFCRVKPLLRPLPLRQDDALLSLELGERSMPETIMNAMEEQLVQDGGLAALQGCVVLDGGLRLRYSKVCAALSGLTSINARSLVIAPTFARKSTGCVNPVQHCHQAHDAWSLR